MEKQMKGVTLYPAYRYDMELLVIQSGVTEARLLQLHVPRSRQTGG